MTFFGLPLGFFGTSPFATAPALELLPLLLVFPRAALAGLLGGLPRLEGALLAFAGLDRPLTLVGLVLLALRLGLAFLEGLVLLALRLGLAFLALTFLQRAMYASVTGREL